MRFVLALALGIYVPALLAFEARIGLSPAAAKKAKLEANIELYRAAMVEKSPAAREQWAEIRSTERGETLAGIAWSKVDPATREAAIRDLARQSNSDDKDGEGIKSLAAVAVAEGDGTLRALARKALSARDDKRTADWLCRAMTVNDPLIKANTLEAVREVGGERVFEVIIEHWKEIWGASARNHVFFGQQRSYVADYEISGDSYDPVVRSFLTGVVLDTKVTKVEADVYYVWIRDITGERKLPNDPAAWQRWLKKTEQSLAKKAEKSKELAMKYFAD